MYESFQFSGKRNRICMQFQHEVFPLTLSGIDDVQELCYAAFFLKIVGWFFLLVEYHGRWWYMGDVVWTTMIVCALTLNDHVGVYFIKCRCSDNWPISMISYSKCVYWLMFMFMKRVHLCLSLLAPVRCFFLEYDSNYATLMDMYMIHMPIWPVLY